jgi:hypothetical protein
VLVVVEDCQLHIVHHMDLISANAGPSPEESVGVNLCTASA